MGGQSVSTASISGLNAVPSRMTPPSICPMKRNLRRGDRVKIKAGLYDRAVGTVDSVVFQRTED